MLFKVVKKTPIHHHHRTSNTASGFRPPYWTLWRSYSAVSAWMYCLWRAAICGVGGRFAPVMIPCGAARGPHWTPKRKEQQQYMHMLCTATCLFGRGVLRPGDWDGRAADDGERDGEGPEGEDEAPMCVWLVVHYVDGECMLCGMYDRWRVAIDPSQSQSQSHPTKGRRTSRAGRRSCTSRRARAGGPCRS